MAFEVVELEVLKHPLLLRRLAAARAGVQTPVAPLTGTIATSPEPTPFGERLTLPARPVRRGTLWGTAGVCAWFHLEAELPDPVGDDLALVLDTDGEAMVLDRTGAPVAAVTSRLTPLERHGAARGKTRVDLTPERLARLAPDGRIELWLDAGFNGKLVPPLGLARVRELALVRVDRAAEERYHDLLTETYASVATRRGRPPSSPGRGMGGRLDRRALPRTDVQVTAIGHGHLDMAWLWPVRETRRKARRTLQIQLDLLDAHPGHTYGVSQPQQLWWIEQDDPALFARLRGAVERGQVELQGGFWVEPDTNLPSGESLVRQAIWGQRYWRSRFGRRARMCWLPDAFGYSAAVPQILRGAGMTAFSTIKLAWNAHNDFPHRSFVWTGHDGSEVLVHMPPEGTYNSSGTGPALAALVRQYPEAEVAPEALLVYGSGDGGGGPGPTHLAVLDRSGALPGLPPVTSGTVEAFFDRLEGYRAALPRWRGELYLEKHQGTLTTQAATKRWNRLLEHRLHDVELLAALAWWRGEGEWPEALLEECWRDVLLFQFHDMLPGSSIARVHRECEERYAEIDAALTKCCMQHLVSGPARRGAARDTKGSSVAASAGTPVVVSTSPTRRTGHTRVGGRWYTYDVAPFATAPLSPWSGDTSMLEASGDTLRTDRLEVTFADDGSIRSLVDRSSGREHAAPFLNRLVLHRDRWSYFDAWDIDEGWLRREGEVLVPESVTTLQDGPRLVRRHVYRHGKTRVEQDIVLTPGSPLVRFETSVDWHERHRMLRAHLRPAAWSDEIACEIQHGHIRRSTREDTPRERAETEICAHRWVDLSTGGANPFGLSLLNDGKYGHRAKGGELSLTLLRAPIYPDPRADRGRHTFTYAIHPHEGGLGQSETLALATDLNAPLLVAHPRPDHEPATVPPFVLRAAPRDAAPDTKCCMQHFVEGGGSVVLDTVTRSEDGRALVLRLYEAHGHATTATLDLSGLGPVGAIIETDLLEAPLGQVDPGAIPFGPFQLRTLRVERP